MCSDKSMFLFNVERKKSIFCTESKSSGAIHDEKPLILELKLVSLFIIKVHLIC